MSNPSINRWGLNLFWYNFWYTDKNHQSQIHQDYLINKLIFCYVFYGLFFHKSIFNNRYWYQAPKDILEFRQNNVLTYFRTMEFKSHLLNETSFFKTRIKRKHLYTSKIWILRYQNWLVVNFYAFQPLKTRRNQNYRRPRDTGLCIFPTKKSSTALIKNKFLLTYFSSFFFSHESYFMF